MARMMFMSQVSTMSKEPQEVGLAEIVRKARLQLLVLRELGAQVLLLRPRLNLNNPEAEGDTDQHLLHCALLKLFLDKYDLI